MLSENYKPYIKKIKDIFFMQSYQQKTDRFVSLPRILNLSNKIELNT